MTNTAYGTAIRKVTESRRYARPVYPDTLIETLSGKPRAEGLELVVTQRMVDGVPEDPWVHLLAERYRADGQVASYRGVVRVFRLGKRWDRYDYDVLQTFTEESQRSLYVAYQAVLREFDAIYWQNVGPE